MKHMRIIGKLEDLGAISEDRKMTIKLSEVAVLEGAYQQGDLVCIDITDADVANRILEFLEEKNLYTINE